MKMHNPRAARSCRVCGCTDDRACPGGCAWLDARDDLCSACVAAQPHVVSMTRSNKRQVLESVATCACGWTSTTLVAHYRKQDAAVLGHWREVVALAGGAHV